MQAFIGTCLGWGMCALYMGGRVPQLQKNWRRGSTEGVSAIMFMLAVAGNATYLASILVRCELRRPCIGSEGACACTTCLCIDMSELGACSSFAGLPCRDAHWAAVRPNLPWVVDAMACLVLDLCILLQVYANRMRAPSAVKAEQQDANVAFVQ